MQNNSFFLRIRSFQYIIIGIFTFVLAALTLKLQFIENFEYQLTDAVKFALKSTKTNLKEDSNSLDKEIVILGITERSQFYYLNNIYGQYPWPRETYANFLSYFRLDDPKLALFKEEVDEVKLLTWNSIRPRVIFFDIFFDSQRKTKLSFRKDNIEKDFGRLIYNLKLKKQSIENEFEQWIKTKEYESDNKFYAELKRHKEYGYIFADYIIGTNKKGRIREIDLKDRLLNIRKWELKNVYNEQNKRITDNPAQHINNYPYFGFDLKLPLRKITENIAGIGSANIHSDPDGKNRKIPLIYRVYDERLMPEPIFLPTINLVMAAKYYGIETKDIIVNLGKSIILKNALIKQSIHYTRENKDKKRYRWLEHIDPFMEHIIKRISLFANEDKEDKIDDVITVQYPTIVNILLKDKTLKEILEQKYRRNGLDIEITDAIYKQEIIDFLLSLSKTSLYKNQETLFKLENKEFSHIDLAGLNTYTKDLENKYNVLKALIKQEKYNNKAHFLFIDSKQPRIAIKNIKSEKDAFLQFIAKLNGNLHSYDPKKVFVYNKKLLEENLISISEQSIPIIISKSKILEYKETLQDQVFRSYIDYLFALYKLPYIIKDLKDKELISYKEDTKLFFDISILDKTFRKFVYLDEGSQEQKQALDSLYRSIGLDNIDKTKLKDILLYLSAGYNNAKDQSLELFYISLRDNYKLSHKIIKRVVNTLKKKKLISYKEKEYKVIFLEINNLERLNEYKDNTIRNIRHRRLIKSLIEGAGRLQEGVRYYTYDIDSVMDYIKDKLSLSKDQIKDIIKKIKVNKIYNGSIETIDIKIGEEDIEITEPLLLISYIDRLSLQINIIREIIKLKNRHSSFISLLLAPKKKSKYNFYFYETLFKIGKSLDVHPSVILSELDYLAMDHAFGESIKLTTVAKKNQFIETNLTLLKSYLPKRIDIKIPINNKAELLINYQGPHKTFENSHFGKYMSTSRERYLKDNVPHPFNLAHKTPYFNWEKFKNKIIFIGFYTTSSLGQSRDYFETPYGTLFGIEIHANALNTILKRDFIHTLPKELVLLPPFAFSTEAKLIWIFISFFLVAIVVYFYLLKKINIRNSINKLLLTILLSSLVSYAIIALLERGIAFDYELFIMFLFSFIFSIILSRIAIAKALVIFNFIFFSYFLFVAFYCFSILKIDIPLVGSSFSMIYSFIGLSVYKLITEEQEKKKIRNMFSKYVSPDLVKQLISGNAKDIALGGEEKIITVLFSDIRGFTSISENLEPHELVAHINAYFTEMTDIILKRSGTMDKYIGDAIMAFWGAPVNIENHALLCCIAGLDMIKKLDELNRSWQPNRRLNIGIGINTGNMTVGNIGSLSRMDYTIMGDSVNLCSRIESSNKLYGTNIIITEYTYKLVKDEVIVRELDLIQVVGKKQPVRIYELLDIKSK